mmetsp:Transcript_14046/g.21454  ORF Transcript_14046/g.21454 Transcript_14046/m.21454 type:complete len:204 (+) Transcript_14046:1635-2246(+)
MGLKPKKRSICCHLIRSFRSKQFQICNENTKIDSVHGFYLSLKPFLPSAVPLLPSTLFFPPFTFCAFFLFFAPCFVAVVSSPFRCGFDSGTIEGSSAASCNMDGSNGTAVEGAIKLGNSIIVGTLKKGGIAGAKGAGSIVAGAIGATGETGGKSKGGKNVGFITGAPGVGGSRPIGVTVGDCVCVIIMGASDGSITVGDKVWG